MRLVNLSQDSVGESRLAYTLCANEPRACGGFLDRNDGILRLVRRDELMRRWQAVYLRAMPELPLRWLVPAKGNERRLSESLHNYMAHPDKGRDVEPRTCLGLFAAAEQLGRQKIPCVIPGPARRKRSLVFFLIRLWCAEDDLDKWQLLLLTTYRVRRIGSHPGTCSRRGFGFVSSVTARNLACRGGRVISVKVGWGRSLLKLSY